MATSCCRPSYSARARRPITRATARSSPRRSRTPAPVRGAAVPGRCRAPIEAASPACSRIAARSSSLSATSIAWSRYCHRLQRRPEGDGPIGGSPQRDPRLARERLGFGAVGRGPVRRQVVRCQCAGELVVTERFEVARRGEVPAAPVAHREGRVGDLADDGLDEGVLAPFRRSRIDLTVEEVGPDQGAEPLLQDIGFEAADRGQSRRS